MCDHLTCQVRADVDWKVFHIGRGIMCPIWSHAKRERTMDGMGQYVSVADMESD